MEILRKIIDYTSLENSQGNFYDGVSFSKVINLQISGCNFAIKRILHRFSLENVPKTSCLKKKKKSFLRKKSIMDQCLIKAAALQYTTLNFIRKAELMQDILGRGFFDWSCRTSRVHPSNFIKKNSITEISTWVLRGSSFLIIEKFSARYFCKTFSSKVTGL